MWKFLPGVLKPKSKRKVDTRESNKHTMPQKGIQWLQMYHNLTPSLNTLIPPPPPVI
jgi:hypothetical protein